VTPKQVTPIRPGERSDITPRFDPETSVDIPTPLVLGGGSSVSPRSTASRSSRSRSAWSPPIAVLQTAWYRTVKVTYRHHAGVLVRYELVDLLSIHRVEKVHESAVFRARNPPRSTRPFGCVNERQAPGSGPFQRRQNSPIRAAVPPLPRGHGCRRRASPRPRSIR